MKAKVIKRKSDGVEVTCYLDGWPRQFIMYLEDNRKHGLGLSVRIGGQREAEGLQYALGKVLQELKVIDYPEGRP